MNFAQMKHQLSWNMQRKALLEYVLSHLDSEFRPVAGQPPKKTILTDERIAVGQDVIESETSFLLEDLQTLTADIQKILEATVVLEQPYDPGISAETQPETPSTTEGASS